MRDVRTLRFSTTHEWVTIEGGDIQSVFCLVGLSQFAADQLADLTMVEFPRPGSTVIAGQSVAVIETVKAVADVSSPVAGKIVEVNILVERNPEIVRADPYGDGWMFKVRPSNPDQIQTLLDYDSYQKWTDVMH